MMVELLKAVAVVHTVLSLSGPAVADYSNAASELIFAFPKNRPNSESLSLFVTSPNSHSVQFSVTTPLALTYLRNVRNGSVSVFSFPETLELRSNADRNKGISVRSFNSNNKIAAFVLKEGPRVSGGFLALPCHHYDGLSRYTYYAVSYLWGNRTNYGSKGGVLIVSASDNTRIEITPSQAIDIPFDLRSTGDPRRSISAGESYTVTLNKLQTFEFESVLDLTSTKLVSSHPIAMISYHECVDVPMGVAFCDSIVEQLPPTVTWGRFFLVTSLHTRLAGERYRVMSMHNSTSILIRCSSQPTQTQSSTHQSVFLRYAGKYEEFSVDANRFCSIQADKPILLVQFSTGYSLDRIGDPFMLNVPPVEQYSNNFTIRAYQYFQNHLTITVHVAHFDPNRIYVSGYVLPRSSWSPIYCSTSTICGYGARISVRSGTHFVYHSDPLARLNVFTYGFEYHTAYGNPAGMELNWIADVCNHGDIRLVQEHQLSTRAGVGQVELCLHGAWSSVSDSQWSNLDAQVVCRQLGHSPIGGSAITGWPVNNNTVSWPFTFTDIRCNGSESKLIDCLHSSSITNRSPAETVYVHCQSFPSPSISLSVSTALHIRSPATLTCVAGINPTISTEVNTQISWNKGHTALHNTTQIAITPTILLQAHHSTYVSTLTIHTMEESHNGIYTCTAVLVSPTFGLVLSTPAVSAVYLSVGASSNVLFQLKLVGVGQCSQWLLRFSTPSEKVQQVSTSIITNILQLCNNCTQLSTNHITDGAFHCFRQDAHEVTFRARLHATPQTNTSDLINHMLQWMENGATISVGGVLLNVLSDCDLVIGSFSDPECESDIEDDVMTTISTATPIPFTTAIPLTTTTEALPSVDLFQLKLIGVGQCSLWLLQLSSILDKVQQVSTSVVNNVLQLCNSNCELTMEHITDEAFQCFAQDAHEVTFRAELYTTNNEDILHYMTSWIQSGATISISGLLLSVDPTCDIIIRSFSDPECENDVPTTTTPGIPTTQISTTVTEATPSLATTVPEGSERTTIELSTDSESTLTNTEPASSVGEHMTTHTHTESTMSTEMPASETSGNNHHIDVTAIVIGSVVVVVIFILAIMITILVVTCLVVKYKRYPEHSHTNTLSAVSPFPPPLYSETTLDTKNDCSKPSLEDSECISPPDYTSSQVVPDDPPLYWEPAASN